MSKSCPDVNTHSWCIFFQWNGTFLFLTWRTKYWWGRGERWKDNEVGDGDLPVILQFRKFCFTVLKLGFCFLRRNRSDRFVAAGPFCAQFLRLRIQAGVLLRKATNILSKLPFVITLIFDGLTVMISACHMTMRGRPGFDSPSERFRSLWVHKLKYLFDKTFETHMVFPQMLLLPVFFLYYLRTMLAM